MRQAATALLQPFAAKLMQQKYLPCGLNVNKYYYFAGAGMKKLAAILLLGIFVFNLFGYKMFVYVLVNQANQQLETVIDQKQYNDAELISVKKPTNLPYYNNTKDFTRAYGEVEMDGVLYQYVKCRIYNDSLEMLCIPHTSKQQLLTSKNNFTQVVFDFKKDANKKSSESNKAFSFIKLLGEFEKNELFNLNLSSNIITSKNYVYYIANTGVKHKATIEQPPDHSNTIFTV